MPRLTRAQGLGLGLVSALVLATPPCTTALAASKNDSADIALLNAAIGLERATLKAYADATAASVLSASVAGVLKTFMADHGAHLDALSAAVTGAGGTPSAELATLPAPSLGSEGAILTSVYALERLVAGSYLAALAEFKNRELAKTAGSILGVDAAHVALLAEALRVSPAYPSGFVST